MAAPENLTGLDHPWQTKRVSMDASAGNARAVQLPSWTRSYSVTFVKSDGITADTGEIASDATDGAAIGNDAYPVGSGLTATTNLLPGRTRNADGPIVYLASGTDAAFAHLSIQSAQE